MHRRVEQLLLKSQDFYPWFIAALVVLSSNWASTALFDTLEIWWQGKLGSVSWPRVLHVAFFILMVIMLYRNRKAFFLPYTRSLSNEPAEPRKHLILFLSNIPEDLEQTEGVPPGLELSFNNLDDDLRVMETHKQSQPSIRWSWEMPLRAIRQHLGTIETITLIGSAQSLPQTPLFLNICQKYNQLHNINFLLLVQKNDRTNLLNSTFASSLSTLQGWNFESFDQLSRALGVLIKEFKSRGMFEREIMIDFTGGQKVTSVVAATMTFNREIKAQYVQTNPPWEVLSFDINYATSDTQGFGI